MSVQAMSWVIDQSRQTGSEFVLMLIIANHAHPDGTNAYASAELLAKECRLSSREVYRLIPKLEASGELIVLRTTGRHANRYTVNLHRYNRNPDTLSGSNKGTVTSGQGSTVTSGQGSTVTNSTPTLTDSTPTLTNGACHIRNRTHEPMNPKRGDKSTKGIESNGHTPPPPLSASPVSEPGPAYRKLSDLCRISLPATERENSWLRAALSDLRKKMQADTDSNPEGDPVNSRMACQALEVLFAFWKSEDWRGKKGEAPSPIQLVESYGAAKVWARN